MTRLTDERLAEIRKQLRDFHYGGGSIQDDVGFLLAEVDFHRAKDAELHRLASKAQAYNPATGIDPRAALIITVLDKCRPA